MTAITGMFSSSLAKAALSAAVVGALLAMLRRASPRTTGLAAAVPISSTPALFWLSLDHGGAYAATAALGSLWGTGLVALLGLTFARMTKVCATAPAALLACLAIGAMAALIWALPAALTAATGLALLAVLTGQAPRPHPAPSARQRNARSSEALLSMAAAGAMSLLTTELARRSGPQFCGLIATIPVVGMSALLASHRQGGGPLMLRVLDGYLAGMLAKAAFLGALVLAWRADSGAWAWAMALIAGGLALLAQRSLQAARERARASVRG